MRALKIHKQITARTPNVSIYLTEVDRIDMIKADEEVLLATKIKQGDAQAREKLIKANLRFVISCAKQYAGKGIPLEDCINAGNMGLCKAADRFDPTRGFKFISFAVWWIRQSILQFCKEEYPTIRLPCNLLNERNRALSHMEHELMYNGRNLNIVQAAEEIGIDKERIQRAEKAKPLSFDAKLKDDDDGDLYCLIGTEPDETDEFKQQNRQYLIKRLRGLLSEKEFDIITKSFGLIGRPLDLEEIARQHNLSRERIRQQQKKALDRLKKNKELLIELC